MEEIIQLDEAIAVKAHTLKALQKSYESFACRPILQERLKLQNELLKRDLQAIDVQVLDRHSGIDNSGLGNSGMVNSERVNSERVNSENCAELKGIEAVDDAQDKTQKFTGKPKRLVHQSTTDTSALNDASQDESLGYGLGEGLAPRGVKPSEVTPKVTPVHRERKTTRSGRSPESH